MRHGGLPGTAADSGRGDRPVAELAEGSFRRDPAVPGPRPGTAVRYFFQPTVSGSGVPKIVAPTFASPLETP